MLKLALTFEGAGAPTETDPSVVQLMTNRTGTRALPIGLDRDQILMNSLGSSLYGEAHRQQPDDRLYAPTQRPSTNLKIVVTTFFTVSKSMSSFTASSAFGRLRAGTAFSPAGRHWRRRREVPWSKTIGGAVMAVRRPTAPLPTTAHARAINWRR